jgi:hypothetical protein
MIALALVALVGADFLMAEETNRSTLSVAKLSALQWLIKPHPGEAKWMEIPWEIDVREARKKAAAEGKPIFFLTAGGHSPLGDC